MTWRIIPACAGFTTCIGRSERLSPDHPRSRGVYMPWEDTPSGCVGSSPLARGLPVRALECHGQDGIISARAGFTRDYRHHVRGNGDHPRSRGVYFTVPGTDFRVAGSSPLARGLPHGHHDCHHYTRIIPARAGFTVGPDVILKQGADHPRSRGVYLQSATLSQQPQGSSPLARGLLPVFPTVNNSARIIPARAGFTIVLNIQGTRNGDHPRSRGVYGLLK
mgnify:CR=1 FL=1